MDLPRAKPKEHRTNCLYVIKKIGDKSQLQGKKFLGAKKTKYYYLVTKMGGWVTKIFWTSWLLSSSMLQNEEVKFI